MCFWVDLPNQSERSQIFQVHLNRLRPSREFDLELLASRSKDFSGAEIEQVIYEAMQSGFSRNEEFTMGDLLDAIANCISLAKIAQPQIEALKSWAVHSGAKSASFQVSGSESRMLSLLEVDS